MIPGFFVCSLGASKLTPNRYIAVVKINVPLFERFFLQPLIPSFRILELMCEKRYKFDALGKKGPYHLTLNLIFGPLICC